MKKMDTNGIILNNIEEFVNDEYNSLNSGDVIWAKRYASEEQMLKIQEGHREGPYIVINKSGNKLKCLYASGNSYVNSEFNSDDLILNNPNYLINKITYVHVARYTTLTKDRFIKKLSTLTPKDKKNLYKKMNILYAKGKYDNSKISIPEIPLEAGDVFLHNNRLFLIVYATEEKFFCIRLFENSVNTTKTITLDDNKNYYLNFSDLKQYSRLFKPQRYSYIDDNKLKIILVWLEQHLNFKKRKSEISRGSLIRQNGIFYYVYGEVGSEWMAFAVFGQTNNNFCHLIINNKHFYTDFSNNIRFSKNIDAIFEVIAIASEKEMDVIKDNKKAYLKTKKNTLKKSSHDIICKKPEIQVGTVVRTNNECLSTFHIIILRNQDEVVAINYSDYKNGNYVLNKFFITQLEKYDYIDNFDLKKVLIDIQDIANGYINKKKLKQLIKLL